MSSDFDPNDPAGAAANAPQGGPDEGQAAEAPADENAELAYVPERSTTGRNTALVLMGFALAGAATIYFMRLKGGPAAALASKDSTNARTTINEFLKDGPQNISKMQEMLTNTKSVVDQFKNHEGLVQVAVGDLQTNPFRMKPAKPEPTPAEIAARKAEEARLAAVKAEEERLARERKAREQAVAEAAKLRLSSVMVSGRTRTCMINGSVFTTGQRVDGFLIREIRPSSVVVERGPYLLEVPVSR